MSTPPVNWVPSMNPKDWLDVAIAIGLIVLSVDKWVHGRETAEDQQKSGIRLAAERIDRIEKDAARETAKIELKIETETGRLWKEFDRVHKKASEMASEFQAKGGELSSDMRVMQAELKHISEQITEIFRTNERRRQNGR